MHTTPSSLLERLRQPGQAEAWVRFVDLYTPLLYHWARRAGLQEQDAADLVQDVLTLLVRKLPEFTYDRQRSFRSWLRTVTLNKLREKQRRPSPVLLETGARPEDILGPDELQALEDAEHHRHLIQHVLKVIEPDFPPLCWKAFQEYVVAGREAAEVAAELHVRIGTVYAAKSRILARLRQDSTPCWSNRPLRTSRKVSARPRIFYNGAKRGCP